ncbi:peptidase [Thalassotalea euphylliae]|uniref:Peptidase n=1 Tax=Thalassotalea euphylliae TaxID=1655234 RepID=A0A3E0TSK3_9GAMM|nr:PepSY-associated TM helix domain-containing protein [Thalassotalea euphylliae]REL26905.1 peptidase [Thalassotalea euphylliae]
MRVNRNLLNFSRLIHVYVSMALLSLMIFFSITGITLNHPEWFADDQATVEEADFVVNPELLLPSTQGQLLDVLLKQQHLNGNRLSIERSDDELFISDKGPGRYLSLTIDLASGEAFKEATDYGYWALFNDLHKGRNSGGFWRFIIDLSAVLMIVFSITGFILALAQRRINRTMAASIITTIAMVIIYWLWV